jgi:hypothetical protein
MQGGLTISTGLSGFLLETDPNRALAMRKYALTMGTLLQGYASRQDMLKDLERERAEFILFDYSGFEPEVLDLVSDIVSQYP